MCRSGNGKKNSTFNCEFKCKLVKEKMHLQETTLFDHLAHSMTKLCQGREQDNASWASVPVYDSSGGKAVFIVVCRGGDLLLYH